MRIFGYFKKCYYLCSRNRRRFSLNRKVQISFDLPRAQPIECYSLAFRRFKFHLTFLTLDQMQASLLWFSLNRKVGRVIDRAGLEIRYTPFGYRGFESLTFRQKEHPHQTSGCSFFRVKTLQR